MICLGTIANCVVIIGFSLKFCYVPPINIFCTLVVVFEFCVDRFIWVTFIAAGSGLVGVFIKRGFVIGACRIKLKKLYPSIQV